jgi:bacillithiol biosynthesis deacetylase BshB1
MMTVDILAIGAHPDDVEIGCGGTLALCCDQGKRIGILCLTRGERGTRGDAETRVKEASAAARVLGAEVCFLDCGDGGLRAGSAEEDALIAHLRRFRPEVVLAPPPSDRHPDHARAHVLVRDACYYAGLARRGEGSPHRPGLVLSYQLHDPIEPTLIVDVTASWPRKLAALAEHRSQFAVAADAATSKTSASSGTPDASTKVSSPEFWLAIEGRARHYGMMIGSAFGEPFLASGPLPVSDLFTLTQQRLR